MAPWPKSKVTESPALEHTGLDYFQPLYIKKKKTKWEGLGMHTLLHYCKSNKPRTCRRHDIETIFVGAKKICDTPR